MNVILENPYYRTGSVIAKLAANWATIVWSIIIIVRPLSVNNAAYAQLADVIQARWLAVMLLLLAVAQVAWIMLRLRPRRYGSSGYLLLTFFWTTLLVLICLADGPVRAAPIAGVSTVVILAGLAFVTQPRSGWHDGATG